ncbi:MAG TPA: hypothetical protein VFU43_15125 [Streptosporangiaceae bacterium]|nr:hypothetical protein [Streptosporangiaceae bacterium]
MQEPPPPLPLPRLAKGRHKAAGDEACVMELVSFLNEEEWSDHPRCVQPVLAAVARAVNDRVSDEGRQRLVDLAPLLAGTAKADWLVGARLVVLCTEAALNAPPVSAGPRPAGTWGTRPPHRMSHDVWQELTAARRTARYLLGRQSAADRARCPWRVRATIWLLDRAGLLKRVYPFDAALQVAFAIAQIGSAPESEPELLALLEACAAVCAEERA